MKKFDVRGKYVDLDLSRDTFGRLRCMDAAGIRMLSTKLERPNIIEPVSILTLVELTRSLPCLALEKWAPVAIFISLSRCMHCHIICERVSAIVLCAAEGRE